MVPLVTFDGAAGTSFQFKELNDPVMGGRSSGTWQVDSAGQFGIFDGEVLDVPSLKAPGFIKAAADGRFPDASTAAGGSLILKVRSSTPSYEGFRVSFASGTMAPSFACAGGGSLPLSRGCFKAKFSVPTGGDFVEVRVPFQSFSDKWSPATGEQTTACADDKDVCPTAKTLAGIQRVELWAEGKDGKIHLEVQSISAELPQTSAQAAMSELGLATFDGAAGTTFDFKELNDPVMGGKSAGTWHVDSAGHFGVFDGQVVNVPSLSAPGFIKAAADGTFPDVSAASGGSLLLRVRSSTSDYQGFRVSFASGTLSPAFACSGGGSLPLSRGCFKTKFSVPAGADFAEVRIPFSSFSDKWSPATGEQTVTCASDTSVCPTAKTLSGIKRIELWAEGVNGKVHLEVQSISAETAGRSELTLLV